MNLKLDIKSIFLEKPNNFSEKILFFTFLTLILMIS